MKQTNQELIKGTIKGLHRYWLHSEIKGLTIEQALSGLETEYPETVIFWGCYPHEVLSYVIS